MSIENINFEQKEKYHPKINFYSSVEDEVGTLVDFWYPSLGYSDEHKGFFSKLCPDLAHLADEEDEQIARGEAREYFENYYSKHGEEIENEIIEAEARWNKVSEEFFEKIDKMFNNYPWPGGNYRGQISVMKIWPRYIKEKRFTFPHNNKPLSNIVIAHEMMHFIQYDYLEKVKGLKTSESDDKDNKFWKFTEILNRIIENDPIWDFLNTNKERGKSNIDLELFEKMEKLWKKNPDIDYLVSKIFPESKNSTK